MVCVQHCFHVGWCCRCGYVDPTDAYPVETQTQTCLLPPWPRRPLTRLHASDGDGRSFEPTGSLTPNSAPWRWTWLEVNPSELGMRPDDAEALAAHREYVRYA